MINRTSTSLASSLIALTVATMAYAQDAAPQAGAGGDRLQDIVVTARRVNESLQAVPVAVTGYNSKTLAALDIKSFADIGKTVPNLDVQRQFGSASAPQFYLRGVSTGSLKFEQDAGIGLYVDGVYLGRPAGTAFNLADIDRVEVLRGPQGTLFGRNATGGAINFITAAPKGQFAVRADGTVGNYDRYKGRISVDLPAVGPLSARVSYVHDENSGYVKNLTPGRVFEFAQPFGTIKSVKTFGFENTDAFAAAVRLDLDRLVVDYKFDYTDKVSSQLGEQALSNPPLGFGFGGVTVPASTKRLNALPLDFASASHLKIQGHSVTATYKLTDDIAIKSITAYRKLDEFIGGNDIDGAAFTAGGLPFEAIASIQDRHQHQWSEEAQLLGKTGNLDWVVGGFWFNEKGRDNNPVFIFTPFLPGTITPSVVNPLNATGGDYFAGANGTVNNKSYAGYAHLGYKSEHFELAGGLRYTKDKREENLIAAGSIVTPTRFKASNDHWDFDATATYIANSRVRTYARFATGYLSGGVLGGVPFKPETIQSYEIGLKGDFLDNRFRVNAAAFHSIRKDVQILSFSPSAGTFLVPLSKEKTDGLELELTAVPTDGLTFNASVGYLHDRLSQDLGARQSQAPKYTASVSGQYDLPKFDNGSYVSLRMDGFFKDKRNSDPIVSSATANLTRLPSRFDINGRAGLLEIPFAGTTASVSVWVQNLTNNKKLEFARDLGSPLAVIGVFQVPRTYGLDFGVRF
jgi:iron complex outermembrane receptor protein